MDNHLDGLELVNHQNCNFLLKELYWHYYSAKLFINFFVKRWKRWATSTTTTTLRRKYFLRVTISTTQVHIGCKKQSHVIQSFQPSTQKPLSGWGFGGRWRSWTRCLRRTTATRTASSRSPSSCPPIMLGALTGSNWGKWKMRRERTRCRLNKVDSIKDLICACWLGGIKLRKEGSLVL